MKKLWAPWRSKFIHLPKMPGCIFCGNNKPGKKSATRHIVARSKYCFSMLNLYPYNNGHIMVAPYRHVNSLEKLSDLEVADMMSLVNRSIKILRKKLKPHGFNVGMNIGRVAGAGFAGHVHMHIVPRWNGDTNFMPVVCNDKVVPESLDRMCKVLKGA